MPLSSSYKSAPHLDRVNTVNHAFQKINGAIIADIDNNGYIDIITFPSNFTVAKSIAPVVWSNVKGVFTSTPSLIANQQSFQYVRDSVAGDFNGDGFQDYFLVDTGWELNDRNPEFFYGNNPGLLLGNSKGLYWESPADWLTARDGGKSFNHIGDTADYDGDGDLDIAIADFRGYRLYKNDGQANFSWQENAIPSGSGDASGTTFIKLGDKYAIVNGYFRIWDTSMTAKPLMVLEQRDGKFFESYTLARPDLGGRERNFGVSDMYNVDLNGDGREDLIVTWETENRQGINDGLSDMTGAHFTQRYKDLGNTMATVWFQDSNGKLYADPGKNTYNFGWSAGAQIYFLDFNKDGHIDFYNSTFGVHPSEFNKLVWINDGKGKFTNNWTEFTVDEVFPEWMKVSPHFFDANGDGSIDVLAQHMVVDNDDYFKRNVGEEIIVFLNNKTENTSKTDIESVGEVIVGTDFRDVLKGSDGDDIIIGKAGPDRLIGKNGSDVFVFDTLSKSSKDRDIVADFDPSTDTLTFDTTVFEKFAGISDPYQHISIGSQNQDHDDWLVYNRGKIYYDTNGDQPHGQVLVVTLIGSPKISIDNIDFEG